MNEIVKAVPTNIIRTMDDAERAARAMSASGFFSDSKAASQAIVKILAGMELGFGPFASMVGVHIIKEKPTLAANLMAAAVKRSGKYNYKVVKHDENECHLEFYELWGDKWEKVGDSIFTIADAKKAQVYESNPNWKKYPRNQLFARAMSNGQKWYAPDAFNGATVYTPDEMGAVVNEEGNVIDVKAEPAPASVGLIDPEEIYNEAAQVKVKVKGGVEKAMGELTKEQLDYVIQHSVIQRNADAAAIVMQHDYGMEPEPEPAGVPAGQLM
jgi:hypothetical protein